MRDRTAWLIVLAAPLLFTPLAAHHSFGATYDSTQPRHVEGTVMRVEWRNPHTAVDLRVADPTSPGGTTSWRIEMGPTAGMIRNGWTATTLRSGMEIAVDGFANRNGTTSLGSAAVTIKATGQTLTTPTNWMPPGAR